MYRFNRARSESPNRPLTGAERVDFRPFVQHYSVPLTPFEGPELRIAFTLGAAVKASLALLVGFGVLTAGASATAATDPQQVPEEVADYFRSELVDRLADLYGPGADGVAGLDFDEETTVIGPISRLMVWTEEFRAGVDTDLPVELSNNWVAAITEGAAADTTEADAGEEEPVQLGVATVWISPYTNEPELASFVPSSVLGPALAAAPEGSMLVHDAEHDGWYALTGRQLTPLAQGGEPVSSAPIPLADAQQTLWQQLETLPEPQANQGFIIAGLTLAFVVVLLAIFVLVPDRRKRSLDPEAVLGFGPEKP
jgi:hypothetical protein